MQFLSSKGALGTATRRSLALGVLLLGPWAAQALAGTTAVEPPGSGQAFAYIGPGAGFAAAGSVLILASTFLLAVGIVLVWPFKAVFRLVQLRGRPKAKVKRFVVLGLDGFDPGLAQRFMAEGRM